MSYDFYYEPPLLTEGEYAHVVDHLKGLIEDVYVTGNVAALEDHLDEVVNVFGLKLPNTLPVVSKDRGSYDLL